MANIKVSEMTEATSFDDGDYTMIVQANQNKKINKENMFSDVLILENEITVTNNNIGSLSNLKTDDKSSIVNSINELKEKEIYSTTEVKTNKVWVDDKPIYRIVIIQQSPTVGADIRVNINSLNSDTIIDIRGFEKSNNFPNIPINFYNTPGFNYGHANYNSSNSTREIIYKISFPADYIYLIIEYTKTTN